jgi:hypothetical protein
MCGEAKSFGRNSMAHTWLAFGHIASGFRFLRQKTSYGDVRRGLVAARFSGNEVHCHRRSSVTAVPYFLLWTGRGAGQAPYRRHRVAQTPAPDERNSARVVMTGSGVCLHHPGRALAKGTTGGVKCLEVRGHQL